jgi:hypothetical protein
MYISLPKLIGHVYRCREIRCADGRTDGQSVGAETAAVNMKGDAQRTAAVSKQCDLSVTQTVSAPDGADVPASCNILSLQTKLVLTCLNHDAMKVCKGHGGKTPYILHLVT